jgi:phage gp36-like protein
MLAKVAAGELTLGLSADGQEPPIAGVVEGEQGSNRVFTRKKLRGY